MHIILLKCPHIQIAFLEIHQLWQSGFSRVYSNCCCSCSFKSEIIKIGQLSHKMYSNNILNFQESMTILNACTKNVRKLIECTTYIYIFIYTYVCVCIYPKSIVLHWGACGVMLIVIGNESGFQSWTRLSTFHIALTAIGKVWINCSSRYQYIVGWTRLFNLGIATAQEGNLNSNLLKLLLKD